MESRREFFKKAGVLLLLVLAFTITRAEADDRAWQVEAITVTADKRAENIQDVPVAITAFSETELEDAGIDSIGDVIDKVPNMTMDYFTSDGSSVVSVRGMRVSDFTGKNPIVIYVDGVPLDNAQNYDADLFNIQRVEVLRGPQGTVYGKNAIGGVINVITKKPGNTLESKISLQAGENETYGVKAFVNGPIAHDKLFFGVSGKYYETRGFMKNDNPAEDYFDSQEMSSFKALLKWLPSDGMEVNLHAGIDAKKGGSGKGIASDKVHYHENRDPDNESSSDIFTSALNISYKTPMGDFTSITTYKDAEVDIKGNNSYLNYGVSKTTSNTEDYSFTQEFRIQSGENNGKLKWLAGLYYSAEKEDFQDYGLTYPVYKVNHNWPGSRSARAMAAFGQITIPLLAKLNITTGARYEKIHKEVDYLHRVTSTATGDEITPSVKWSKNEDWGALLPKAVVSLNINKDAMVYFSVAQGYLAGGINSWTDDKDTAKFDEQTSVNYEIGTKSAWFDNRLFLNTTLFYIDIEDIHVYSNPQEGIWIASNAGKAHSQGIEIEAKARPLQGLDIAGSLGFIEAAFDDYKVNDSTDYTNNTPTQTPSYTLNLSTQYRHSSGFYGRVEMEGYGKTYYDEGNTIKRGPFELYHGKIGYEASNWEVYIYGNNLLDKEYFSSRYSNKQNVGDPRTIGVIASIRF